MKEGRGEHEEMGRGRERGGGVMERRRNERVVGMTRDCRGVEIFLGDVGSSPTSSNNFVIFLYFACIRSFFFLNGSLIDIEVYFYTKLVSSHERGVPSSNNKIKLQLQN